MASLYVVATPIGNLGDMSPRAIEVFKSVSLIAAEDTRVTQKLLSAFDIHTPLTSCHEHNERFKAEAIVSRMLKEDINVAVVTDAGTPCISDPGCILTGIAVEKGIEVLAVPGPTAMASALSVSGFSFTEFSFYGFLPRQKSELKAKLLNIAQRSRIAVVHESPHRVTELLNIVSEVLPHTLVSASCDLTKKYEKTIRGKVTEVLQQIEENPKGEKGEYCLVMQIDESDIPISKAVSPQISLEARLFDKLLSGMELREAQKELVAEGEKKNAVYAAALRIKGLLGENETLR